MNAKFPLTAFLCAMMRAPRADLLRANPDKLAAKYGIPADWARFYLNHQINR
jgi:hypothetical protein